MKNLRFILFLVAILIILSIPYFAGADWNSLDYIVGGLLLLILASAIEFALRMIKSTKSRILVSVIILVGFALVWGELAVGIFGTPFAGS